MKAVHIGCSGWNYAHWRERVYPHGLPQRRWLAYYARMFDDRLLIQLTRRVFTDDDCEFPAGIGKYLTATNTV